jgi:hypothetical protein
MARPAGAGGAPSPGVRVRVPPVSWIRPRRNRRRLLGQAAGGTLKGRHNCCILGAKDVGKTCWLKALVCLNSVLSGTTLSIFIDGRMIEHHLSELIVSRLDTRSPDLMATVRPGVKAKLKAVWEKNMSYVVQVLRLIKRRVLVVLDEVDCAFKRPEQKHVLQRAPPTR